MTDTEPDAMFVGGPRDGELFDAQQAGLVEVLIDGMLHRYIPTTATREQGGTTFTVYNYDGEIRATGDHPDIERR
jgi:hypothetical protein